MKARSKFESIKIPEGIQYTAVPKLLSYKKSGFSYVQQSFLLYLLSQPQSNNGMPWIYRDEKISEDTGISLKSIGRFKNSKDPQSLTSYLNIKCASEGQYKTGGFTVDFTPLWKHLSDCQSKSETGSPSVETGSPEFQTGSPKSETERPTFHITPILPYITSFKQKEESESNEATDSQETREEQLKQPKQEIDDTMSIYDPDADDGLDDLLAAHGIGLPKPEDNFPIREKIKIYFSKNFPAKNGGDYEPAFNKANISDEKLFKAWKYISNWGTYYGAKGTDRNIFIFTQHIDKFIAKYEKEERIETVAVYKADEQHNSYMSRKNILIDNGCWYTPDFQDDDNLLWTQTKKNKNLPEYLKQYMQNPTSIINSSGEIDNPEKYTKEAILGAIK